MQSECNGQIYVAIGSSAGGLEALQHLVVSLVKSSGFIYIIAQHHSLAQKSVLASILGRKSVIPITTIEITTHFKPDILYILPPHLQLISHYGKLKIIPIQEPILPPLPLIDTLFYTLTQIKEAQCIAILLSGTGHDGTAGMIQIKENNGITIVQSPEEAHFDSMLKSAIDAGVVDYILPVYEMTQKLKQLSSSLRDGSYVMEETAFERIRKIVQQHKQIDFYKYKDDTIQRRIQKRMTYLKFDTLEEYATYLSANQQEVSNLEKEIFIGVTSFFRDPKAFEALKIKLHEKIFPLQEMSEFRIWSVACSTGEEAYSLAIIVMDICEKLQKNIQLKIFASDIDDRALGKGRVGEYSKAALQQVEPQIIKKYFVQTHTDNYQIIKELRNKIVFTHHNFLQDPPFINIDLISCRNVLIYLLSSSQHEVFHFFHYALKKNALLFLGSSESTLASIDHFITLDQYFSIYEKEGKSSLPRLPRRLFQQDSKTQPFVGDKHMAPLDPIQIENYLHDEIFNFFSPSCIVVDQNYDIVYKKGLIPYIHFSDGIVNLNLLKNLDTDLQYEATLLLNHIDSSGLPQSSKFIEIGSGDNGRFVRIIAQPLNLPATSKMIFLYFQDFSVQELRLNGTIHPLFKEKAVFSTLSAQLAQAREEVQNLSDELLFLKQNMSMINAELQDSNEKLQSTVEEFETSNQELQSSNEELHNALDENVNLQQKLSLIFEASLEGIIILDLDAKHIFVNDQAADMLGYTPQYLIGKESHSLWHHTKTDDTSYPESECPLLGVLKDGEKGRGNDLFWRKDGSSFEVSLSRSPIIEGGKISGALIFFHDISDTVAAEKKAAYEHQLTTTYLEVSGLLVMILDTEGTIISINRSGAKILGAPQEKIIGQNWFDTYIAPESSHEIKALFKKIIHKSLPFASQYINPILDAEGNHHLISWNNALHTDKTGNIIGVISTGNDITQEESLTQQLMLSSLQYETTFKAAQIGIAHVALDGSWIDVNEYLCHLIGYTKEELLLLTFQDITHPDDIQKDMAHVEQLLNGIKETYGAEKRYIHKNGNIVWIYLSVYLLRNSNEKPLYFISTIQDISQIKMLMFELDERKTELENIIKFAPNPIILHDEDGLILMLNDVWSEITGYALKETPTLHVWAEKVVGANQKSLLKSINNLHAPEAQIQEGEYTIRTKEGKMVTWIISSAPLGKLHNNKHLMIVSAMDVTELQSHEKLMLAQSRQAAMGDMIGMIAHQWRQPLTVISMVANNLKAHLELEDLIPTSELEKLTNVLSEQTQYLSRTIDDFRNFFKPDKRKEKVSLCEIYDRLKTIVDKTLVNNQITLSFSRDCTIKILTFPNELVQVLINLINNAKDAIKEQNIQNGKINIQTTHEETSLTITVQDNGGGIESTVIEQLGEPYITTKKTNGTGLGLYMSKIIIEKHLDGRLQWKNCDKGSCFSIILPYEIDTK